MAASFGRVLVLHGCGWGPGDVGVAVPIPCRPPIHFPPNSERDTAKGEVVQPPETSMLFALM